MKRIVGADYENGMCVGITVDGILDNNTNPNELVNFERVRRVCWNGHWILIGENSSGEIFKCSVCGSYRNPNSNDIKLKRTVSKPQYCEVCGAKMDE